MATNIKRFILIWLTSINLMAAGPKTNYLDAYVNALKEADPSIFTDKKIKLNKKTDELYIIDMQNDFLGHSKSSPRKGRFNVAEGEQISNPISKLIGKAGKKGIKMVASRDYHPNGHVSLFSAAKRNPPIPKGPFPDHCIMGSDGSSLAADIKKALLDNKSNVTVTFKGIQENVDSFGDLPYEQDYATGRISMYGCDMATQSCLKELSYTGGFEILEHDNPTFHPIAAETRWVHEDSITENPREAEFKQAILNCTLGRQFQTKPGCVLKPKLIESGTKNVFVTGLAADFCVLDSAINAKKLNPNLNIYIVYDLTRYAWFDKDLKDHGRGPDFADGRFITDISEIVKKYKEFGIRLIHSSSLKF